MALHDRGPRLLPLLATTALLLGAVAVLAAPAEAVQAPVAFTAAPLPTWQTNGIAWTTATAGGLVFVGGTFSTIRPPGAAAGVGELRRKDLAVFDAATGAPMSCAPDFEQSSGSLAATVRSLNVSPDGLTLYAGGLFSSLNGVSRNNIAALRTSSCTVVTAFTARAAGTVRVIASTPSAVYLGGDIAVLDSASRHYAGAVTPATGALLPWAPVLDRSVRALTLSPQGDDVVLGGDFTTTNGTASPALSVVDDVRGATVKTFPQGFFPTTSTVVKDLTSDPTGFYAASEGTGRGKFDGRTAINWHGYTKRWTDRCLGATQAVVVYQGLLYSGSHAHDCSSMGWFPDGARHHFLAETTSGAQIEPWFPNTNDGLGEGIGPRDLVIATVGSQPYLWAAGEFTSVNGKAQQGLTRFGSGPDTTAPTAPVLTLASPVAGQVQVSWRTSVDPDDALLTYRVFRDGGTTPVLSTTATSWFWSQPQRTWTDTGLVPASRHSYRVTASDGTSTCTSATLSITVEEPDLTPDGTTPRPPRSRGR